MAVTKSTEFRVKMSVEDKATGQLDAMGGVSKTLKQAIESLTVAVASLNQTMAAANNGMVVTTEQATAYAKVSTEAAVAAEAHSKALQRQGSFLGNLADGFASLARFIQGAIVTAANLVDMIFKLTEEKNLTRMRGILSMLAIFARLKGQAGVAEGLVKAGDKIVEVGTQIHVLGGELELYKEKAAETFDDMVKRVGLIAAVIANWPILVGSAAAGIAGLVAAAKGLNDAVVTVESVASSFRGLSKTAIAGADALQKFGKGGIFAAKTADFVAARFSDAATVALQYADANTRLGRVFLFLGERIMRTGYAVSTWLQTSKAALTVFGVMESQWARFLLLFNDIKAVTRPLEVLAAIGSHVGAIFRGMFGDLTRVGSIVGTVGDTFAKVGGKIGVAIGSLASLSGGFAALGFAMLKSDSATKKLVGGGLLALGIALGGILATLHIVAAYIGDVFLTVGNKLFFFFDAGIEKAKADEEAFAKFGSEVRKLGLSFEATEEHMNTWGETLRAITANSKLTAEQAQGLGVDIIRLGQRFGFTLEQQQDLAKAIAAMGRDSAGVAATMDALTTAFLRSGTEAQRLGIDLSDNAINASEYAQSIGKVVNSMSEHEKAQAKLSLILARAEKSQGAAAAAALTYAQILDRVKNAEEELSSEFAASSIPIYKKISEAYLIILTTVRKLPPSFFAITATISTVAGAFLMFIGVVLKFAFTIVGLMAIFAGLNAFIMKSAAAQAVLFSAFTLTNTAVKAQTVAIVGLSSVLQNLANFGKGAFIVMMGSLYSTVKRATLALAGFTWAILSNPLFIKGALIVGFVFAFIAALQNLRKELDFVDESFNGLSKTLTSFTGATEKATRAAKEKSIWAILGESIRSVWKLITDVTTFLVGAFLNGILVITSSLGFLGFVLMKVKAAFTGNNEAAEAYKLFLEEVEVRIQKTSAATLRAGASIFDFGTSTAYAAGQIGNLEGKANGATSALERMVQVNLKGFSEQNERLRTLGSEYDAALVKQMEANAALREAMNSTKDLDEKAKDIAEARKAVTLASLEIEKLRDSKLKEFDERAREAQMEALKRQKREIEAIRIGEKAKLDALQLEISGLQQLKPLTEEQAKRYDTLSKAIRNQANMEALEVQTKKNKELSDQEKSRLDKVRAIEDVYRTANMDAMRRADNQMAIIKAESAERSQALARQIDDLKALGPLRDSDLEAIRKAEEAIRNTERANIGEVQRKGLEEATKAAEQFGSAFAQLGAEQEEIIDLQLKKDLADLDILEAKLTAQGAMTDAIREQLKLARASAVGVSERKQSDIPFNERSITRAFKAAGVAFSKVFAQRNKPLLSGQLFSGEFWKSIGGAMASVGNIIAIGFAKAGEFLVDAIVVGAEVFRGIFSGDYLNKLTSFVEQLGDMPALLLKAFQHLDVVIKKIISTLPGVVSQIVVMLPELVKKITEALPKLVDTLVAAFPRIARVLAQSAPAFTSAILAAIPKLIRVIPVIIKELLSTVPEVISRLMDALPEIVTAIFDAIPAIFQEIFKVIPAIIENLLENIDEVVYAFVEGFISGIGEIVASFIDQFFIQGGAERVVGAILRAIPRIVVALVKGIINGLAGAFKAFGFTGIKLPEEFADFPEKLAEGAKGFMDKVVKESSQLFKVLDLTQQLRGASAGEDIRKGIESGADAAVGKIRNIWKELGAWVAQAWQKVIAFFEGLGGYIAAAWAGVLSSLSQIGGMLAQVWADVFAFFRGLGAIVSEAWKSITSIFTIDNFKNLGYQIWLGLKNGFEGAWTWLSDNLKNAGRSIWNSLALSDVWTNLNNNLKSAGRSIWNSIALDDVWKMLVANMQSLGKALFSMGGAVGGSGTGNGQIDKWLGYGSTGGVVYAAMGRAMPARGTDTVPAMLTPGEFVVNRASSVANRGLLESINGARGPVASGIVLNVTINAKTLLDAAQIKAEVVPELMKEIKRKSIDGKFVLAASGVR